MRAFLPILVCLATLPALFALPVIRPHGIQNAASYEPASFSGSGLAPGSIFVIKGSGLGPETLVEGAGGTEVFVRSVDSGIDVHVTILHSWSWQVAAILPDDFPLGSAELILTYAGQTTEPINFNVIAAAPGLFTVAQNGWGAGVIQNFELNERAPLNGLTRPAHPGQYIILWGTGLGRLAASEYEVFVHEARLEPDYAGPAPGYPGLDQINVRLPADGSIPEGCYVRLSLRAGDTGSQSVFVTTASNSGPCDHPWDLSAEQLARLDAGETVPWARLSVFSAGPYFLAEEQDSFYAELRRLSSSEVASAASAPNFGDGIPSGPSRFCYGGDGEFISTRLGGTTIPNFRVRPELLVRPVVDAGETLRLNGPEGKELELFQSEHFEWLGSYEPEGGQRTIPKAYFDGGAWTLSAAGGDDIGPFTTPFTLPPPVRAELPEVVDRSQDLVVTWNPDGLTGEAMVVFVTALAPPVPDPENPDLKRTKYHIVECHADPADGSATIPSALLAASFASEDAVVGLSLAQPPGYTVRISIPGIEYATFTQSNSYSQSTAVR